MNSGLYIHSQLVDWISVFHCRKYSPIQCQRDLAFACRRKNTWLSKGFACKCYTRLVKIAAALENYKPEQVDINCRCRKQRFNDNKPECASRSFLAPRRRGPLQATQEAKFPALCSTAAASLA